MKHETYLDVRACLPPGKSPFLFYPERFAFDLLRWAVDAGADNRVAALKVTRFGRLLRLPGVKRYLAARGDARLDAAALAAHLPGTFEPYLLTVGEWSRNDEWAQTSRPGSSLVLQLNFTNKHDADYRRLVKPRRPRLFNFAGHPVRWTLDGRHETLAWARLDFDLDSGEALIEELQSDWVRDALESAHALAASPDYLADAAACDATDLRRYVERVLPFHVEYWAEAMLNATLVFLRDELGLRRIWMHDFETGNAAKGIAGDALPPRSLYTRLPRRFGFQRVARGPNFICKYRSFRRKLRAVSQPRWHYLELD